MGMLCVVPTLDGWRIELGGRATIDAVGDDDDDAAENVVVVRRCRGCENASFEDSSPMRLSTERPNC